MSWSWEVIWEYLPRLLDGVWLTLELVLISAIAGILVAVPLALMRTSKNRVVASLPWFYIYFFRGTPLLVQIFLIYYGSAQFSVIRETFLWAFFSEPYWCALLALTLNTAAYSAELIRGAIQSIPIGEIEAAEALGMRPSVQIKRIILPRAFGIVLPAYGNELILMLKGSALVSTITLLDLTGMARTVIARTYTPLEIFFAAGVLYLLIAALFILLFRFIERWLNRFQYPR